MSMASAACRKVEPEYLGPLAERPLAETAPRAAAGEIFPGASGFLRGRQQERRRGQWASVRQMIDRLLDGDEHVLYVAHAIQNPGLFHSLSLGYMAYAYHQVLLVLTERRLIEIMLNTRGTSPGTRTRSYPWRDVRDLRLRLRRLALAPANGRAQSWTVPLGGDRKLLKMLLPRLAARLLPEGGAAAVRLPLWHCPQCGKEMAPKPSHCEACGTRFRSARLTAWLSIAFPGAGLLYAGHPVLACFDFVGEILLFGLAAFALASAADPTEFAGAIVMGLVFFAMTKTESLHLGHILVARTRPDTPQRRSGFRRLAVAGGLLSLLAVAGALYATGRLRPAVARDLGFDVSGSAWTGGTDAAGWRFFANDPSTRSQWTHEGGLIVTLFAYPLGDPAAAQDFRRESRDAMLAAGGRLLVEDEQVPAPFQGFRLLVERSGHDGEPITVINYFLYDRGGADIHQVLTAVPSGFGDEAQRLIGDLLGRARWVKAAPPVR